MITLKGIVTEIKEAEMEVSKDEIIRCAKTYLSARELILMARKTWLDTREIYYGQGDIKMHTTEHANGIKIHTWLVWNVYRSEWCALSNNITYDDVITWDAFQRALEAVG